MDFLERSQEYVPLVLREWSVQTRGRAPWRSMPLDDVLGELQAVTSALLEVVGRRESAQQAGDAAALEAAARRHGAFRRQQGCEPSVITEDYDALRRAIRATLRTCGIPVNRMAGVLYETLVALRLATRASAREYTDTEPVPRERDGPGHEHPGPSDS